ncbi:hypothetical protein BKA70DRAFT_1252923 [Coprinopsis sp. MPI-PUGE-AT-0042]|nr:hypothetical protein BKA70DRAFT_1252923 [Coprinopsis sp. MPI-PUGE-AT-0042]
MDYESVKALHAQLPPFSPLVPVSLLPTLALVLLASTFGLTFYFSTLPKSALPATELGVAAVASTLAGFGVVALFCTAGVNV